MLRNFLLILILISWQVAFATGPLIHAPKAHAAQTCTTDTAGPNDVPGQKDLTQLCVDYAGLPTSVSTAWNWDETGTSGSNTMDACNLFDTNGNGNADYAVCVTTTGDPAAFQTLTTYSCGDARADRCTSPNTPISNGTISCSVTQSATDPFSSDASFPTDTQGSCTVPLSTVGGGSATLIDVCSYPSSQPNSDPSDCVIAQPRAGELEVKKHLIPNTDSGVFNLQVNSVTKAANVGDGGTTGKIVEPAGNNGTSYTVGETAGTATSLSSYNSSIECRDLNGTGNVVASGNTTSTSVTVNDGVSIVCVITNTLKQATLVLQKTVINDNGGTLTQSNFPVAIGSSTAQWGSNTVSPGTYTVSETQQTGYQAGSWGTDCTAGGSVTLAPGQTKTCSITNNDIAPQLTVIKHVVNNNGGTALASSFTMNVTGTNVSNSSFAGAESPGTTVTLNAGSYSVDESAAIGYSKSLSTDCSGTIAIGQTKTCTITNDDIAPNLTVTKVVVNPYGTPLDPTAFPLFVDSISVTTGVSTNQFNAGTHTVTETQQTGYTLTGVSGNCTQNQGTISLTLSIGGTSTCTLTNTAIQPKLTVIKHVINDNGGSKSASDFTMNVTGTNVSSSSFAGAESPGTTVTLNVGSYSVDEGSHTGYTETKSADCSGSITIGQTKTCTITNDDIAPSLTLNKIVSNTHGGTAVESNWTLTATGPTTLSGPGAAGNTDVVSDSSFKAGTYTLSESGSPTGYSASSWTCDNNVTVSNSQITLNNGQATVCTITNSDVAPSLTVTKVVVNPYGTPLDPSAFPLFVDSISVTSGVPTTQFNAGAHTVTEAQHAGYTLTGVSGDCNQSQGTISLTLSIGGTSTCTLTNTAIQPKLIVIKHVINDNGGTKTAGDFTMTVTGNSATVPNFAGAEDPGTTIYLNEGSYSVNELSTTGYSKAIGTDCSGTISIGQTKTCTITNDDIAPSLTLNKIVSNSHGGTAVESDWTLTATGPSTLSGPGASGSTDVVSGSGFKAGTYALSESGAPTGYSASSWTCTNNVAVTNNQITLANGQSTVCSITNSDIAPSLTVTKIVINPYGTALDPSSFPLFVDGISVTSGAANTQFNAGTHTVTETQQTGYTLTGVGGDCSQNQGIISLTLSVGGTSSCTLTNTAIQPKLTVIKHVINDNSGTSSASDFLMTVTGNSATVPNFAGAEDPGTTVNLNEGSYTVDEVSHDGYTETKSVDCSGTISIGQTKTCTITNNDIAHPSIHIVKSGPATAHEGDTVTYTFTVTNTGDTNLSGVTVNDDIAGAGTYLSGDTNHDNILQKTETWIYTKDYIIPADQTEDVVNTAEVCSYYLDTKVCDTDHHTLDVLHPAIQVQKFGPSTAFEGDTVTYTFIVTNIGDTQLNNVGIADDLASGESCLADTLAVDASTNCTATYTIPTPQTADVTNHVLASGTDSLQKTVTDTDQHTLDVLHPSIHVVKSGPASAVAGTTVTYTFTVTNTGDVPLSGLTVQDNIAGAGVYQSGDTNHDGILQEDETWIYTAQYAIPSNQFNSVVNTVTACGTLGTQLNNDLRLDTVDEGLSKTVCSQDKHILVIPKVLAEVTPPQLVNTGQPIAASIVAGSLIVVSVLTLSLASRRQQN